MQAEAVPWLPGPLSGSLSIGGGLLALLLPETLNRPLPQTIEDIENWSKVANDGGRNNQLGTVQSKERDTESAADETLA